MSEVSSGLGVPSRNFQPRPNGMFDDDVVRVFVSVADGVSLLGTLLASDSHESANNLQVRDRLRIGVGFGGDVNGGVAGIREEAALVGLDGIEKAFAGKAVAFDDGEGAGVERGAGGVAEPEGVAGDVVVFIPDGDFERVNTGLHDGHERGLVFADGDGLLDVVGEELADFASAGGFELGFEVVVAASGADLNRFSGRRDAESRIELSW